MQCAAKRNLTVIVPNYNHATLLSRCLNSILTQSRLPDEILICDDASTDNSMQIINDFAKKYPIIRVIQNEKNCGVLATGRRLLSETRSELVTACAADDEICQGFIESIMQCAEEDTNLGMYVGRMTIRSDDCSSKGIKDKEFAFGWNGPLSAEEFRKAPSFLDPWLGFGLSVSAVFRRDYLLEALAMSMGLGPKSDIFWRLFIAAKYGLSIKDVPGMVFYMTSGGYSRQHAQNFDLTIEHARRYILLYQLTQRPDIRDYFPRSLLSKIARTWFKKTHKLLDRIIFDDEDYTSRCYSTFDKLNVSGNSVAKYLGAIPILSKWLQRKWLKFCLKCKFC